MANQLFKHTVTVDGSPEAKQRLAMKARNLGYKCTSAFKEEEGKIVHIIPGNQIVLNHSLYRDQISSHPKYSNPEEFVFNSIDDALQFEQALAIAAIRNDESLHVGEWVERKTSFFNGYNPGRFYKIEEITAGGGVRLQGPHPGCTHMKSSLRKATAVELLAYDFLLNSETQPLQELTDSTPKNTTIMSEQQKPTFPFSVTGPVSLVKALAEELTDLGVRGIYYDAAAFNLVIYNKKEYGTYKDPVHSNPTYFLPQDWETILSFMKEALDTINVTLDDGSRILTIRKDGTCTVNGRVFTTADAQVIREALLSVEKLKVGAFEVQLVVDDADPIIRIGCVDEDYTFSLASLEEIIKADKKLRQQ